MKPPPVPESRPVCLEHDKERKWQDNTRWLTSNKAALYLGTTVGSIRNRVYRGDLTPYKPFGKNGRLYFDKFELDRIMQKARLGSIYGNKENNTGW